MEPIRLPSGQLIGNLTLTGLRLHCNLVLSAVDRTQFRWTHWKNIDESRRVMKIFPFTKLLLLIGIMWLISQCRSSFRHAALITLLFVVLMWVMFDEAIFSKFAINCNLFWLAKHDRLFICLDVKLFPKAYFLAVLGLVTKKMFWRKLQPLLVQSRLLGADNPPTAWEIISLICLRRI